MISIRNVATCNTKFETMKKIKQWFLYRVIGMCDHKYYSDKQIKVIRCEKCGDERWYDYKNLW
jgi:hypothetical protein